MPKLIGKKAPLNCLLLPDQHYRVWLATQRYLVDTQHAALAVPT